MKTSLPIIARPEAWRDYYEPATGFRLNRHGDGASASDSFTPSPATLAGAEP
jgi:hypothetical protein